MPLRYPVSTFLTLAKYAEELMGGTSGAVYSLMFVGAAQKIPEWPVAWENGLNTVLKYSTARLGHRTMVRCNKNITNITLWNMYLRL